MQEKKKNHSSDRNSDGPPVVSSWLFMPLLSFYADPSIVCKNKVIWCIIIVVAIYYNVSAIAVPL